jgi:hypothetical protein
MDTYQEAEKIEKTIQPKEITFTYNVTKISIKCRLVNLNKTAVFDILFYDQDGRFCRSEVLVLSIEEYRNWGTDDDYIFNLIQEKYGIVFT